MERVTPMDNYQRICLIRNDIGWIKKAIYGIFGGLIINIVVNLIT